LPQGVHDTVWFPNLDHNILIEFETTEKPSFFGKLLFARYFERHAIS
jgi:hypothetical protein